MPLKAQLELPLRLARWADTREDGLRLTLSRGEGNPHRGHGMNPARTASRTAPQQFLWVPTQSADEFTAQGASRVKQPVLEAVNRK